MEGTLTRGKKWASGTVIAPTNNNTTHGFTHINGASIAYMPYIDISSINFIPSCIIVTKINGTTNISYHTTISGNLAMVSSYYIDSNRVYGGSRLIYDDKIKLDNGVYRIPVYTINIGDTISWIAYE